MADSGTPQQAVIGDRGLFPELAALSYLGHAAISPPSRPVVEAGALVVDALARGGRFGFDYCLEIRQQLRERLAQLIGATATDIGFVQNTSVGLGAIASSLKLNAGDGVLLFDGEYPSNVIPFQAVARRSRAEVRFVPAGDFLEDESATLLRLDAALANGATVLSMSAVQFQTGARMPIRAIGRLCRKHGVLFVVDAVQALGMVDIDVQADLVDVLCCGAHKWLMGLSGVGFVYVRPEVMGRIDPVLVGALSSADTLPMLSGDVGCLRYDGELLSSAQVFESGMLSDVAVAALDTSLALIQQIGVQAIYAHVQDFHDGLEPRLVDLGFRSLRSPVEIQRSGTMALRPPDGIHVGKLVQEMQCRGVAASGPDGVLRLAPHWPNALSEVPIVERVVCESLNACMPG